MRPMGFRFLGPVILVCTGVCFGQTGQQPSPGAAARFLEQASWGPTTSSINMVRQLGFSKYIDEQFALPGSPIPSVPLDVKGRGPIRPIQNNFYLNAVEGQDQLRQRVAFALNQIWVISAVKINNADAMRELPARCCRRTRSATSTT